MTMQGEIREEIDIILNTELSEVEDQINKVKSLLEDKMSEIEEIICSAIDDLDSPVLIDDVKETLTKLAEDI